MMMIQSPSVSQFPTRREPRALQIRRVVEITADNRRMPFTLYNLSSRGAAGRSIFPIAEGTQIKLMFEDGFDIEGRVRWTRNGMVGIAFRGTIPSHLILPPSRIERHRAKRFNVMLPATFETGDMTGSCLIHNVSDTGLMIETSVTLAPGKVVTILSTGFDCCGQVRWMRGGRAGIRLFVPLDLLKIYTLATSIDAQSQRMPWRPAMTKGQDVPCPIS